jgi:radical SAM protein with 4Fe4S-binding SPASM domain
MEGRVASRESSQTSHVRAPLHDVVPLKTPFVVYVEPSGACNLKCGFCPVGIDPAPLKKNVMAFSLFTKMVDDIAAFPSKIKLLRVCGNGEPLVNKDIVRMLAYARERNIAERIEMISNGLLLTDRLIAELPQHLDRIIISIEGLSAAEYLSTCRTTVDFSRFADTLRALYKARGTCVVHLKIHHEAVRTDEALAAFKALVQDCSDEYYVEKLVPMWPELDSPHFTKEFRWEETAVTPRAVCVQIFKGLQVQADGEVVPCCVDWKRVNVLGDIRHQSVSEIWNGERIRHLQRRHLSGLKPQLEPCRSCTMNDYCDYDNLDDHAAECLERIRASR